MPVLMETKSQACKGWQGCDRMSWYFKKMVKELPEAGLSNVHNNHMMYLQQCLSLAASQHEDGTRLHVL